MLNACESLYLNIYAPANATSTSGLPVKVWLYGGAFEGGGASDPLYDGCFSSSDAVVVTLNYRLGPLGYLAVESTTLSGNYGILDQLQAIRWVHDNIAAFGGSPVRRYPQEWLTNFKIVDDTSGTNTAFRPVSWCHR